ncbi:MAG TPA: DUF2232 domain-containing protein [Synergistaceae bacterium]|nr:DUF2232 domain-containing protein [Synergistaceae bacterium]
MTSTRSLVESALLAGLAVVLFLSAEFLPFVGLAFSLLAPAPLVVLGLRHNGKMAVLGLLIATTLIVLFLGPLSGLFFLLGFGVLGVSLGWLAKRCKSGAEVLLYGILVSLGSKLLLMTLAAKITGINPFQLDAVEFQAMVDRIFSLYQSAGMSPESLAAVRQQFAQAIETIPMIFPAILTAASALDCYLSYTVSSFVLKRIGGQGLPALPPFSHWRFPKSLFGALIASMVFTIVGARGGEAWNIALRAGVNLRMLLNFLFLLQGLSLIWYLLKGRVGKALAVAAIILVMFVPLLSTVAVMAGIADMWLDFRARYGRNDP